MKLKSQVYIYIYIGRDSYQCILARGGCLSEIDLNLLVPLDGNMNSEIHLDILVNTALATLWKTFWEGRFSCNRIIVSVTQRRLSGKGFATWIFKNSTGFSRAFYTLLNVVFKLGADYVSS